MDLERKERIWWCKIGGEAKVRNDAPMRAAVEAAFKEVTGQESAFVFSGWNGHLTEPQRAAYEDREPTDKFRDEWHDVNILTTRAAQHGMLAEAVVIFGERRAAGDSVADAVAFARREWDF